MTSKAAELLETASRFLRNEIELFRNEIVELVQEKEESEVDISLELEQQLTRLSVDIDNLLGSLLLANGYKGSINATA